MPKARVKNAISEQEMQFAHLVLQGTMTDQEAAVQAGFTPAMAPHVKRRPRVQKYMNDYSQSVMENLANNEAAALAEFNIGREQILALYWKFARIDPSLTGHNTSSQTRALDSLWKALGYDGAKKPGEGESPPQEPDVYVASWMRERSGAVPEPVLPIREPIAAPEPVKTERRPAPAPEPPRHYPGRCTSQTEDLEGPPPGPVGGSFGRYQELGR